MAQQNNLTPEEIKAKIEERKEKVNKLLKVVAEGIDKLFNSVSYKKYLLTLSRFHSYSANNVLLIALQRPQSTALAGYNSWTQKFKRQVRSGEKGISILAPCIDSETGGMTYRIVYVFDIDQTEGEMIPELIVQQNVDLTVSQRSSALFNAIREISDIPTLSVGNVLAGEKGIYSEKDKAIMIKQGLSEQDRAKAIIRNYILYRLIKLNVAREEQELIADSIAFIICEKYGLDLAEFSFSYIAAWQTKDLIQKETTLAIMQKLTSELLVDIEQNYLEQIELLKDEQSIEAMVANEFSL